MILCILQLLTNNDTILGIVNKERHSWNMFCDVLRKVLNIKDGKLMKKKTVNIVNIGSLMRKYAPGMQISPSAVHAMIDRMDMFLQIAMPEIAKLAKRQGCKTIKEIEDLKRPDKSQAHITLYFGITRNDIKKRLGGDE